MPHGGLGTLAPSQQPTPGTWVERGAIADAAVRRLWLRNSDNVSISAAGLTTTTMLQGGGQCGVAAARFTRSSDSLVQTVAADDIIAVSST